MHHHGVQGPTARDQSELAGQSRIPLEKLFSTDLEVVVEDGPFYEVPVKAGMRWHKILLIHFS